jgi:hypothetical protein
MQLWTNPTETDYYSDDDVIVLEKEVEQPTSIIGPVQVKKTPYQLKQEKLKEKLEKERQEKLKIERMLKRRSYTG